MHPPLTSSHTKSNVSLLGGKLPDDDVPRLHIEVDHVLRLRAYLHLPKQQNQKMTFDPPLMLSKAQKQGLYDISFFPSLKLATASTPFEKVYLLKNDIII